MRASSLSAVVRTFTAVSVALWASAAAAAPERLPAVHHEITATLDPAAHALKVTDRWRLPASVVNAGMTFTLNAALKARSMTQGVSLETVKANAPGEDVGMDRESANGQKPVAVNVYRLTGVGPGQDVTLELAYEGEINNPITSVGEEYARGFSQSPGLIEERGAYLAGSSMWVPQIKDTLVTYRLSVDLPQDWKSVSQGTRLESATAGDRHKDVWSADTPTEEIYIIAAKFTEYSRDVGQATAQAFLRTPDDALAARYLEATAGYMEMYRNMIGPYPYSKFALVENFWETGYGMPSFTLLGEQVIRFPFILNSSYPHELLHNWWGNGVFVDFDSGNWCEGLTAYLADHLVAEQNGQGNFHRRDILLRVTDYVTAETDFPLRKFKSRYNPVTEAVGYGKTAMVFDMLRGRVGDKVFIQALQKFYRDNKFRNASFADIRASFEAVSGQDLKAFFDQWVEQTGMPDLKLGKVDAKGTRVTVSVEQVQPGKPLALDVPVVFHTGGQAIVKSISFKDGAASASQTFDLPAKAERVEIDPQFNVYRRLSPFEVPTSMSKAFGAKTAIIVLPSTDEAARYVGLVKSWTKSGLEVVRDADIGELPADRAVWVLGATNKLVPAVNAALKSEGASLDAAGAQVNGTGYAAASKSLVFAARHPKSPSSAVVFISATSEAAADGLARKLPHYGKYSWLVFGGDAPDNEAKGEWTPRNTPLARDLVASPMVAALAPRPALASMPSPIDEARMKADVTWLADPAREGRGVGTAGLDAAAAFIAQRYKDLGLKPLKGASDYMQPFTAKGPGDKPVKLNNIIGVLEGSNPAFAGQSLIVSAHYDHLGRGWPDVRAGDEGKIHPGADDNASGVAAILEVARLMKEQKPQRTVVFAAFSGEESGLQGAKAYVAAAKDTAFPYPLAKIMGVLNVDTVGRLESGKVRIFGGETAREWAFIFQGTAATTGIAVEVIAKDIGGSDQKAFAEAGVPSVQVFASTAVDYHRPTDTVDKLDSQGLVKVVATLKEAADYLAARPEPMAFTGPNAAAVAASAPPPAGGAPRRVATGLVPDMAFQGQGVRAASVAAGSGAALAGLREGDVVVSMAGQKIDDLKGLSNALKTFIPAQMIDVVFIRDGKTQTASMRLGER
ncbi:MAG: M20/M25/M40 family metallo-hydrolase [Rhodospirillaceae bacterium]|nr:M20/M25/M40 family metallo-hydrolase [Rhodospirillaceae bacterium]